MPRDSDRRLRTRYKARIPFVLRNDGQEIPGITRNVSLLGISAFVNSSISQVQPVRCLLNVPQHSEPLIAHGTVIRCEALPEPHPDGTFEVGVFFKEFEGAGEGDLSKYLNQLREQEQSAIQEGYRALKQRLAARRRRKQQETLRKRRRKLLRLRRRKKKLAAKKRSAARRKGRPVSHRRPRRSRSS